MIRAYIATETYDIALEVIEIVCENGYVNIATTENYDFDYRAKTRSAYGMKERTEIRKAAETGFYESELIFEEYRGEEE